MSAVVLFSGGVDSTTAVAKAVADGHDKILLLTIRYGSRHQLAETTAAEKLAMKFVGIWPNVEWYKTYYEINDLFAGGESSLMGDAPIPAAEYQDLEKEGPSDTVVPFRNANFISVATTQAIKMHLDKVYIAVHATDHNKWAYSDCSPEFIGGCMGAVYVGSYHKVRLVAPFLWMTKTEVIALGYRLNAPLELTYSCYRGGKLHCGACPTCLERHMAFLDAVGLDPTTYETGRLLT